MRRIGWMAAGLLAVSALVVRGSTILVYEGFAANETGSGDHYQAGEILGAYTTGDGYAGVGRPRLGFEAGSVWYDSWEALSADVNATTELGSLTYPGFITQDDGHGRPYRSGGPAGASKAIGRNLDYTLPGDEYYVGVLVDFGTSPRGGVAFGSRSNQHRYNRIYVQDDTIHFTPPGNSSDAYSTALTEGTHLVVVRYFIDGTTPGNPNASFYDRWEVWIDPEITGPALPAPDASGWGIGLKYAGGGNVIPNDIMFLDASNMASGQSIQVDEFYIATDPSAFLIPEPSAVALLGLGGLALLARRRRRG